MRRCLRPLSGTPVALFAVAATYTASFEGLLGTATFLSVTLDLRASAGTGPYTESAVFLAGLVGFALAALLALAAADRLGAGSVPGLRGSERPASGLVGAVRQFGVAFLPLAAAGTIAHGYPAVLRGLGRLVSLTLRGVRPGLGPLDPLAGLSEPLLWWPQLAALVAGHLFALAVAGRVGGRRYPTTRSARRATAVVAAVLTATTLGSLWIATLAPP